MKGGEGRENNFKICAQVCSIANGFSVTKGGKRRTENVRNSLPHPPPPLSLFGGEDRGGGAYTPAQIWETIGLCPAPSCSKAG